MKYSRNVPLHLQNLTSNNNKTVKKDLEEKLKAVDDEIADIESEANFIKLKEQINFLEDDTENLNSVRMWQLKKKICSKVTENPVAKKDESGNYVTEHSKLKSLYVSTYKKRMAHRKIKPHLEHLYALKMQLFKIRYDVCKSLKSPEWSEKDLVLVLKNLKKNKSADSNGLVYELFRPEVIGMDLFKSLLMLCNSVKSQMSVPRFLLTTKIHDIKVGKGSRDLLAQR